MKRYKKCSGQCVECVHFYTIEGCGDKHNGEDTFESVSDEELDKLISLSESLGEEGYFVWIKEVKRNRKLNNIISLTKQ